MRSTQCMQPEFSWPHPASLGSPDEHPAISRQVDLPPSAPPPQQSAPLPQLPGASSRCVTTGFQVQSSACGVPALPASYQQLPGLPLLSMFQPQQRPLALFL